MEPARAAPPQTPITLQIVMTEFAFTPSIVRIQRNRPAQVFLVNRGQIAHQLQTNYFQREQIRLTEDTLYVEAPGLDLVRLQPGSRAKLEFLPRRSGRFTFTCTIEGHQEAGMKGLLVVR